MSLKQIFILFFTFCFFSVLLSVSTTWTGNVSNDWHNPGNWDNGVPDQTMDAVIPLQSSYARDPIVSSGDAPCANLSNYGNLSVQNDFSLNVQNNCDCDLMGSIELFNGNVNVGGTMENFGNVVVSDEFAAGTSSINCSTYEARVGSTTHIQANGSLTCTQFNAVNQSTTNLNSGELSCTHLNDNGSIAENGGEIAK